MGIVKALTKSKAKTVIGVDSSTHSIAFAVFRGDKLERFGKVVFTGNTSTQRLVDAQAKMLALGPHFEVDYIAVEKAIFAKSIDTAIKMGMTLGVIIASVSRENTDVVQVPPVTWQSYINNNNYTKTQKQAVEMLFPDKSDSWIKNHIREERKQYTINYFNKMFNINIDDNDVADAIGIGWYAVNNLVR